LSSIFLVMQFFVVHILLSLGDPLTPFISPEFMIELTKEVLYSIDDRENLVIFLAIKGLGDTT
jgi:hypothetical protein